MRAAPPSQTVSEIAAMLSLSDKTASAYRTRVLEKLSEDECRAHALRAGALADRMSAGRTARPEH